VFADVQAAYLRKLQAEGGRRRMTVLSHNGMTVTVLLSANTRLYGDLLARVYERFIEEYRQGGVEATIIGKVGLSQFKEEMGERVQFTYFDYPDGKNDKESLAAIVAHLVQYEEIHVHYGKYKNVLTQEPEVFTLSASQPMGKTKALGELYMFEPSLEAVMAFFEHETFGTLLDQTIREAQLAKFAARVVAMDRADQEMEELVKTLNLDKLTTSHQLVNRRQLNSMPALIKAMKI
jgi:F0F1-type ATP synthase gamma subunit